MGSEKLFAFKGTVSQEFCSSLNIRSKLKEQRETLRFIFDTSLVSSLLSHSHHLNFSRDTVPLNGCHLRYVWIVTFIDTDWKDYRFYIGIYTVWHCCQTLHKLLNHYKINFSKIGHPYFSKDCFYSFHLFPFFKVLFKRQRSVIAFFVHCKRTKHSFHVFIRRFPT